MVVGISDEDVTRHHVDSHSTRLSELPVTITRVTKLTVI